MFLGLIPTYVSILINLWYKAYLLFFTPGHLHKFFRRTPLFSLKIFIDPPFWGQSFRGPPIFWGGVHLNYEHSLKCIHCNSWREPYKWASRGQNPNFDLKFWPNIDIMLKSSQFGPLYSKGWLMETRENYGQVRDNGFKWGMSHVLIKVQGTAHVLGWCFKTSIFPTYMMRNLVLIHIC